MILFLTLLWIAGLALSVKLGWIKLTLWWKLSPIFWSIFLLVAMFIPLQFWAPSGSFISGNYTVAIVPQVAGEVIEIQTQANIPLKKGQPLFRIDPSPYRAALDNAQASLELAKIRFKQEQQLLDKGVAKQLDFELAKAQLDQKQALYERAQFDLEATQVVAPSDGYVTNMAIRAGARAVSMPFAPSMAFVETGERIYGGFVLQNHLRYIKAGQTVEIALKMYPGKVITTEVSHIIQARATGLETVSGAPVIAQEIVHAPFAVRLKPSPELEALQLPAGASGRMVIYSEQGNFTHVIRKVEIRITAIMNYINPF